MKAAFNVKVAMALPALGLLVKLQNQVDAKSVTSTKVTTMLPLLSHEHILQRHNIVINSNKSPALTSHGIPIQRKLDAQLGFDGISANTLNNMTTKEEVDSLYLGYGTHYVDLWVGTPPQRQTVIVDTGSGVTAFPCQECINCGNSYHASRYFMESESETFQVVKCGECTLGRNCLSEAKGHVCHLQVYYAEGSMWSAYESRDMVYMGGLHNEPLKIRNGTDGDEGNAIRGSKDHSENPLYATDYKFEMAFGCQTKITGLFKTQLADGIMGMDLQDSSLFFQMYEQQVIDQPSFSICFTQGTTIARSGTLAGALTLGGTDEKLHKSPMLFAKGMRERGFMHGVRIRKIHMMESGSDKDVGDATISNTHTVDISYETLNANTVIIDSGRTTTYLTNYLSEKFKKLFREVTGFSYREGPMDLTDDQVKRLPTILIQLKGAKGKPGKSVDANTPGLAGKIDPNYPNDVLIAMPPAHYVVYDSVNRVYLGRLLLNQGSNSVLGANAIRGYDVLFDIPSNGRIGFAPSDCDYKNLTGIDVTSVAPSDNEMLDLRLLLRNVGIGISIAICFMLGLAEIVQYRKKSRYRSI